MPQRGPLLTQALPDPEQAGLWALGKLPLSPTL